MTPLQKLLCMQCRQPVAVVAVAAAVYGASPLYNTACTLYCLVSGTVGSVCRLLDKFYGRTLRGPLLQRCDRAVLPCGVTCGHIYSTGYKQPHENAHIKFCRQILGVHNKAMRIPVLAELGRFPVSLRLVGQVIAFWAHIVTSDADSYTRNIYADMTEHQSTDKNPWLNFIKNILRGLGMTHVWDNHSTFSADRLKRAVLVKLQDRFSQFWQKSKEGNQSRMAFYASVTHGQTYRTEPYLLVCTKLEHRKALCRLRISAHDLQIERGRYANMAREDRKCRTCGVVEDELHFLNDCTRYDLLRQRLLDNPNVRNLCSDGTINNNYRPSDFLQLDKAQIHLAEYVYNCMSLRI